MERFGLVDAVERRVLGTREAVFDDFRKSSSVQQSVYKTKGFDDTSMAR